MKRLLIILAVVCLFAAIPSQAQLTPAYGNITAAGSTCATAGACVTLHLPSPAVGNVSIQLSGTFTLTGQFEQSSDNQATWDGLSCVPQPSGVAASSATAADLWVCAVPGATDVRVRGSAYTSGTAAVVIQPSNTSIAGAATPPTGTSATQVQGTAADGAAAAGNPVQVGGVDASGNAQVFSTDTTGRLNFGQANAQGDAGFASTQFVSFACNTGSTQCVLATFGLVNNGTNWDRVRSVINGQNTAGTGVQAVGDLCQLDDTSTGAITENQWAPFRCDSARSQRVDTEGQKATYSAVAVNFAPAATPTDVCVLPGSASKTIRISRIMVQGFATTKGSMALQIIKRAAADTAGTSAGLTAVPYDSGDAAASAAPLKYTANPTINSTVGNYDTKSLNFAVAGDESTPYIFETGYRGGAKALVLRGVAEQVAVNLSGAAVPTGGTIGCSFEWTEE